MLMGMLQKSRLLRLTAKMVRNFGSLNTSESRTLVIEHLTNRILLKVEGAEAAPFLQGLITNDINHLVQTSDGKQGVPAMFALFLNKSGRVLYDTIIYRAGTTDTFLIECDKDISNDLLKHLSFYRVRRKIDINEMEEKPWVIFDPKTKENNIVSAECLGSDFMYASDPRVRGLGLRLLTNSGTTWTDLAKLFAVPGELIVEPSTKDFNYQYQRYFYGVGEGVDDLPPGKCIPLEINGDFLHGISFQKGCYIGQELTARAHHTGVIRKRLMPLSLSSKVSEDSQTIKNENGFNVGTVRGICQDRALALIRIEPATKASKLSIDGVQCFVIKPEWWPKVLSSKAEMIERA